LELQRQIDWRRRPHWKESTVSKPTLKLRVARPIVAVVAVSIAWAATGQIISSKHSRASDADLLRLDLRAHRAEIVAEGMQLSDAHADVFIPIYIDYDAAIQNLWNERLKLIAQYASEYDGITDAQADALAVANLDLDADLGKLRKKYYRELEKCPRRTNCRSFLPDRSATKQSARVTSRAIHPACPVTYIDIGETTCTAYFQHPFFWPCTAACRSHKTRHSPYA
jgi:hypothetical protein